MVARIHAENAGKLADPARFTAACFPAGLGYAAEAADQLPLHDRTATASTHDPASRHRVRRWLALAPRIGEDIFVKLFAHGAQEEDAAYLLGGGLEQMYGWIKEECR